MLFEGWIPTEIFQLSEPMNWNYRTTYTRNLKKWIAELKVKQQLSQNGESTIELLLKDDFAGGEEEQRQED
jgi:hypothetical protein